MTKGRKVTFDEKVEIARYCIAHGRDYQSTIRKYNISYQQIYSWLRKYDNGGIDALVDRRGKAKPENELTDMDRLRIENKMLEAKKQRIRNGDTAIKKIEGDRKETTLSEIRLETKYTAIKELHNEYLYPINKLCKKLQISRSGYYKWLNRKPGKRQIINEDLSDKVMRMYKKHNGTLGSHRMRIFINREYGVNYNHKHIRRIMKILGISSVIRRVRHSCTVSSPKEQAAENILNRDFKADTYNQKWLTDVTEFKYGNGNKAYLSAILDLGDNRIIAWVLGHSSNNELVFKMFHAAIEDNLNAHPPFHSDIGVQYTSPALYIYLVL